MIDLGRITALCTDCPQVIPIAGDLTMDGNNRHIYRLGYLAAQSYGAKVSKNNVEFYTHSLTLYRDFVNFAM